MSAADNILTTLDAYQGALENLSGAAPEFQQAITQHYNSVPIRELTGAMAQAFRNPSDPDFNFQGRVDGFTYHNTTRYVVFNLPEAPSPEVFVVALGEYVQRKVAEVAR